MNPLSILCFALAGAANGSWAVPMKKIRDWKWAHIWFAFTLFANGVLPFLLLVGVGGFGILGVLAAEWKTAAIVFCFGGLWGGASLLYGMSLVRLGITVTNALIHCVAALGASLGPLLFGFASLGPPQLRMFAIALAALITGFCFCARSALLRDGGEIGGQRKWATGILIAVGSGILSAMLNMGFAVGGHLLIVASARGYSQLAGTLILWLPIMAGAAVVGLAYTSRLIQREGTWGYFSSAGASVRWFRALVMGVLCFGTIALFGFGIAHAGRIGFVYGPVMTASGSVITSNLWGVARGEWPTAGPRRLMYAATGIIALAFGLLAIVRNYT